MKKAFLMIFAIVLATVSFSSCSSDDDKENKVDNSIYGVWKSEVITGTGDNPNLQYFYMYAKDGMTYTLCVRYDKNGKSLKKPNIIIGSFETNGNELSELYFGETKNYNFKVENNVLKLYTSDWSHEYTRSSEKEVRAHYDDINPKKKLVGAWAQVDNPRVDEEGYKYNYYEIYYSNGKSYTLYLYENYYDKPNFAETHEATWSFDNYIFKQTFNSGNVFENFISMDDVNLQQAWYDKEEDNWKFLTFKRVDVAPLQQYIDNPDIAKAPKRRPARPTIAKR